MELRSRRTVVAAAAIAGVAIGLTAPAVGHGVEHAIFAHNADKVDGKHAVGSGATTQQRKGKLVATNATSGRLPNNIIAKAPDSNRVDGLDSRELAVPSVVPSGRTVYGYWNVYRDSDGSGLQGSAISYPVPMPQLLSAHALWPTDTVTECPGSQFSPQAAPGHLCLYLTDVGWPKPFFGLATRFGVNAYFGDDGTPGVASHGIWAATAP